MEKYSIQALIPEITGVDENACNWEAESKKVYRIDKMIRTIVSKPGIGDITDTNKDWYVSICKAIYENHEEYKVISKYSKIGEIKRPKGKRALTDDECIMFLEMLLESCPDENLKLGIERSIFEVKGEAYKEVLKKFDEEVERIKLSINGYDYEEKIKTMKRFEKYLNRNRVEIEKNINNHLILK
ncbi:hypothetical protein [Paraclostridium bifermentans]|uniref:hypothetical protein n=1 Tax=Paraclostridium bifermentans TaxID=1490 RepID=UPI0022E83FF6|nr:hypothetical protein [Paraclostridium bifermentans]